MVTLKSWPRPWLTINCLKIYCSFKITNGFQSHVCPWSCLKVSVSGEQQWSQLLQFTQHVEEKKKKNNFGFLTITLFRLSCTSERSTGVNHQPAFGQINQGSIKCCARARVCEDNEGHEVRQQGGRTGVFWGPELSKGPEGWLFHFLDTKERKKCMYIYRYIYIHTHTLQHIQKLLSAHRSLKSSSCHCKLGIVDIENKSFQHGVYIPLYLSNVHTSIYRFLFFFFLPFVHLWKCLRMLNFNNSKEGGNKLHAH